MNNLDSFIKQITKECPSCKLTKNSNEFYKCKTNKNGISVYCRNCMKEKYNKIKDKDIYKFRVKNYRLKYREMNKDKIRTNAEDYYNNNKQQILTKHKKYHNNLKLEVLSHYSISAKIKCKCCGEANMLFLTIDHIKNDGAKHRKIIGTSLYKWLRKNNYPSGFQILCMNCNWGKYLNNNICPHQKEQ